MTVAKVGTDAFATQTAAGTLSPAWSGDQPRTVGHMLTATVYGANAASTAVTCSTPAGWTLRTSKTFVTGITRTGIYIFDRVATGADTAPTFTLNTSGGVVLSETSGLDASGTPQDIVFTGGGASSAAPATSAGTTTNADDFVIAAIVVRIANDTFTWGAGLTADTAPASATSVTLGRANLTLSATSTLTPSATLGTSGNWSMVAVAYKQAAPPASGAGSMTSGSTLGGTLTPGAAGSLVSGSTTQAALVALAPAPIFSSQAASPLTAGSRVWPGVTAAMAPASSYSAAGGMSSGSTLTGAGAPASSGAATATSGSSLGGAATVATSAAGVLASGSALSGGVTVAIPASAGMTSGSALSGSLSAAAASQASMVSGSALTGAAARTQAAAASVVSASTLGGAAGASAQAAGAMASGSALTGNVTASRPLAGSMTSGSALTGAVSAAEAAAGSMASGSALTGGATPSGAASASMVSASSLTGSTVATRSGAGSLTSGSVLAGAAGGSAVVAGTLVSGSALSGSATASRPASAALVSASNLTGSVTLSARVAGARKNLVLNPSFNDGTTSLWGPNGMTISTDTSRAHSGPYSMKLVGTNAPAATYQTIALDAAVSGGSYTLSTYLDVPVGLSRDIYPVAANVYDATGSFVATAFSAIYPSGQTTAGFERFSLTFDVPVGSTQLVVFTYPSIGLPVTDSYWVDDWLLEQSAVLGSYFDGDTPDTAADTYGWTGTPSASASIDVGTPAGALVSHSTLGGSATATVRPAASMASGSSVSAVPASITGAADLVSDSGLSGSATASRPSAAGVASASSLGGAPSLSARPSAAMDSGSVLGGTLGAVHVSVAASMVSDSGLSGAGALTRSAGGSLASGSVLVASLAISGLLGSVASGSRLGGGSVASTANQQLHVTVSLDLTGNSEVGLISLATATQIETEDVVLAMVASCRLTVAVPAPVKFTPPQRVRKGLSVTYETPVIFEGKPYLPAYSGLISPVGSTLSGVGHIRTFEDPDPVWGGSAWVVEPPAYPEGANFLRWTARQLPDPSAYSGGHYQLGAADAADGTASIATGARQWASSPGSSYAINWDSAYPFKPTVSESVHYNRGGTRHVESIGIHFNAHQVDHMWADFGSIFTPPFTVLMVCLISQFVTGQQSNYLLDSGRDPTTQVTVAQRKGWLAGGLTGSVKLNDENLGYRTGMRITRTGQAVYSDQTPTTRVGRVYAANNYKPKMFAAVFNGNSSSLGNWGPSGVHYRAFRLANHGAQRLAVLGRGNGQLNPNHAASMVMFEMRMWDKALTKAQLDAQYAQLASTWRFHSYK